MTDTTQTEPQEEHAVSLDFDSISLESMGTHMIFGEVNPDSMREAVKFIIKANALLDTDEITFVVNTAGGTTNDAFALIDLITTSQIPVRTIATGLIASMGVLLTAAGTKGKRVITRNTQIMAHQFSGGVEGKYHEMIASVRGHHHAAQIFTEHFKRHSTMTDNQIKDLMFGSTDVWLTPTECKQLGLVDEIVDELPPLIIPGAPQFLVKKSRTRSREKT